MPNDISEEDAKRIAFDLPEANENMTSAVVFERFPFHAAKGSEGAYVLNAQKLAHDVAVVLYSCEIPLAHFLEMMNEFELETVQRVGEKLN